MSNPLDYIHKYPARSKQILGISYEQFLQLAVQAQSLHQQQQSAIEKTKIRINAPRGGRQPILCLEAEICLCLFYLRHFPTFEVLGLQFGISRTAANDTFHYWLKILENLLPASLLSQVKQSASDKEMLQELLAEFELLVDSTEQPRERPGEYEEQNQFFSGKKKKHTFKNQFIILPDGQDIVDVTLGRPGPTSDINLFRERQKEFDPKQKFKGDKAYQGEAFVATPHKKPRQGKLSEAQLEENKEFSSQRIVVEHMIRLVKIFQVVSERFRLRPQLYNRVISTVCGLVRLRIGALVLPIRAVEKEVLIVS